MLNFCTNYLIYLVIIVPFYQSHWINTALDLRQYWELCLSFTPLQGNRSAQCPLCFPVKKSLCTVPPPSPNLQVTTGLYRVTEPADTLHLNISKVSKGRDKNEGLSSHGGKTSNYRSGPARVPADGSQRTVYVGVGLSCVQYVL